MVPFNNSLAQGLRGGSAVRHMPSMSEALGFMPGHARKHHGQHSGWEGVVFHEWWSSALAFLLPSLKLIIKIGSGRQLSDLMYVQGAWFVP